MQHPECDYFYIPQKYLAHSINKTIIIPSVTSLIYLGTYSILQYNQANFQSTLNAEVYIRSFQKKFKQLLQPWRLNYMILALNESMKIFFGQVHSFSLFPRTCHNALKSTVNRKGQKRRIWLLPTQTLSYGEPKFIVILLPCHTTMLKSHIMKYFTFEINLLGEK